MGQNNVELKSVSSIIGMKFFIPNYQRGYKWKEQQVKDLLEDIDEFIQNNQLDSFYCLQPLVVKETVPEPDKFIEALPRDKGVDVLKETNKVIIENTRWEVIDGQQRLTTIYILLSVLGQKESYSLEYKNRNDNKDFLSKIDNTKLEKKSEENIDFHYMAAAKKTIDTWFNGKENEYKKKFEKVLLNKVQFIWYESDENPIKVFTRINIGKISLTNAELIKALFLNRSNFIGDDYEKVRLKQYEIANQWDNIEYMLQNEEFWLFLHDMYYKNPTRIDLIFNLMCNMGTLDKLIDWKNDKKNDIGTDNYRAFRYFNAYFHSIKAKEQAQNNNITLIEQCWSEINNIFQTFVEWFNDLELYHYVGYLIAFNYQLKDILGEWNKTTKKKTFVNYLIDEIKKKISKYDNLSQQYDSEGEPLKTDCKPLLLLHNIQTVISQNTNYNDNYKLGVFYKFPFHLYKIEGWDVEHIDSNTENDLDEKRSENEFLLNIYNSVSKADKQKIERFINNPTANNFSDFDEHTKKQENSLKDYEKNQVWNFTLLDSSTNRSYGNSIFSAKRRIIIGKDKGRLISVPKIITKNKKPYLELPLEKEAKSSFIPPCTKQVFLKYYSSTSSSPNYWERSDAEAYRKDIYETLKDFGVTYNSTKETHNEK